MMNSDPKPRIIKDYKKLDDATKEQIKLEYPLGFEDHLISFTNRDGSRVSALPLETADKYYLIRMTVTEAQRIIENDEDYDEDGSLKEEVRKIYKEKYISFDETGYLLDK